MTHSANNSDEEIEGLDSDQATRLHKGAELTDGPFTLSYNDDSEGYYYLRRQGKVHSSSYSFHRVERTGHSCWNLADKQRAGFYLNDIQNYPLLRRVLYTIACSTPDKPPKDR